jgi:hypothetical protein
MIIVFSNHQLFSFGTREDSRTKSKYLFFRFLRWMDHCTGRSNGHAFTLMFSPAKLVPLKLRALIASGLLMIGSSWTPVLAQETYNEQYLCAAELSTGFNHDDASSEWESVSFIADDTQYIVSSTPHSLDPTHVWRFTVTPVGSGTPFYVCEQGSEYAGILSCRAFLSHSSNTFRFNLNNLRFIASSISFSYADVGQPAEPESGIAITNDNADSATLQIGRCSPF